MRIGALNAMDFRPYIYNTNRLSGNSLSKVVPIGDDLLSSKTDFSGLTDEDEKANINPLRKGQTANFMDVLHKQMQAGRLNASRIMKPASDNEMAVKPASESQSAGQMQEAFSMQYDRNLFQMQRAAESYSVNMIA